MKEYGQVFQEGYHTWR